MTAQVSKTFKISERLDTEVLQALADLGDISFTEFARMALKNEVRRTRMLVEEMAAPYGLPSTRSAKLPRRPPSKKAG